LLRQPFRPSLPTPFVLFVYFPSQTFSQSPLIPPFFLSLLIFVQTSYIRLPLSPVSFPFYWYSPTLWLFSNYHLYFLIFFFSFTFIFLIAYYLLFLFFYFSISFLFFPVFFIFILLSVSFHSSFFRLLHSFFLFPVLLVLFPFTFLFLFLLVFSFYLHPSWLFLFPLAFIFSLYVLSNSETAVVLVCIPRVPLRTRWFRNCSLIVSAWGTLGASS